MDFWTLIGVALSLAMDAFTVSISNGISAGEYKMKYSLKMGAFFGFFQFVMTVIGYFLGSSFASLIHSASYWLAFSVFCFIGGKMIYDGIKNNDDSYNNPEKTFGAKVLTIQAIATSIDAMAVGVSTAVIGGNVSGILGSIWFCAIIIGTVAFILPFAGGYIGRVTGKWLGRYATIAGGIVLVGLGIKFAIQYFTD